MTSLFFLSCFTHSPLIPVVKKCTPSSSDSSDYHTAPCVMETPKYQNSKQLSGKKETARWKTGAQQHLQVFWTIFPLLFLNAAFLILCSLFVPVFFSRLFSLSLFCLKCGAIWSILMVHDNYFNFSIHPCWRQNGSTLKCCLWAHIDVRGDGVLVLLLYLKLWSSFLREMTTFIIIWDGLKSALFKTNYSQ